MKKFLIVSIVIGLMVFAVGCSGKSEANDSADLDSTSTEVVEEAPTVQTVKAYGIVDFTEEQSISVDFNARLDKIHVKEGEQIAKGDALVDFDISELNSNVESKKMAIEETKQKLNRVDYRGAQLAIDLENEKANLRELNNQLENNRVLYENGAISKTEIDALKDKIISKEGQIEQIKLNISNTNNQITEDQMVLSNQLNRLNDELRILEEKYSKANFENGNQIVSNIDNGVVTSVQGKEGSYVNREHNILSIVDLDSRVVRADIAEEFISRIAVGQKAIVTSQAVPGHEYTGEIIRIWGTSIKKGGETIVPIEVKLNNLDDKLFLNFNVDVTIALE
ncbi:MAG TPA: efflux RND transporter periplasmic adaptor subunit [Clostridia bacterium]|nr:efflux RND transporter periplasmic adaptor subunit [Clostridia bacterium]